MYIFIINKWCKLCFPQLVKYQWNLGNLQTLKTRKSFNSKQSISNIYNFLYSLIWNKHNRSQCSKSNCNYQLWSHFLTKLYFISIYLQDLLNFVRLFRPNTSGVYYEWKKIESSFHFPSFDLSIVLSSIPLFWCNLN